jgi:hypothetical protein
MTEPELVAIDLTDEERKLMVLALNEYGGTVNTPISCSARYWGKQI